MLRFAVPSKGALADETFRFLESCGLKVSRPNPRRYTASIKSLPDVEVLLHRAPDIVEKVAAGTIDLGVSGYDLVEELGGESDDLVVAYTNAGVTFAKAGEKDKAEAAWKRAVELDPNANAAKQNLERLTRR